MRIAAPTSIVWAFLGAPALAGDLPEEATRVWATLDAVKTLEARFEQVQHRAILTEPLRSTGSLAYARPDKVRWEMASPIRSLFVLDGTRVTTSLPDHGHTETMELSASPEATRIVQGLTVWLGGDLDAVQRDYEVAWTSGPPHVATLTPRNPALAALIERLELTIDGAPLAVRRVILHEPGGDRVEIAFSDVELGAELPPETFAVP